MRKLFISLLILTIFSSLLLFTFSCNKEENDYLANIESLYLNSNGELKILTLADLHFMNNGSSEDANAMARMRALITYTEPDFIVLLGDFVYSDLKMADTAKVIADELDTYEIPWTLVMGNHEATGVLSPFVTRTNSLKYKTEISAVLEASEYAIYDRGQEDVDGYGNFIINVKNADDKVIDSLFFMDSGDYIKQEDIDKYDFLSQADLNESGFIYPSQVSWYEESVKHISDAVNEGNGVVPSLMFIHIPLAEYQTAWNLYTNNSEEATLINGESKESIDVQGYNTGLFDKMVELGSTKAVFVGHDHANNFNVYYKGIQLNYNGGLRLIPYPYSDQIVSSMFGGRVITIKGDGTFTNNVLLYDSIKD